MRFFDSMVQDYWFEILEYLRQNKHRAILSSLGIVWGVFIMVLLIGVATGFENGLKQMFSVFTNGTTYVYAGERSKPGNGGAVGSKVYFTENLLSKIKYRYETIKYISPEIVGYKTVRSKTGYGSFQVKGVGTDMRYIKDIETSSGRFFNKFDEAELRKTAIIGERVVELLFKDIHPIGREIEINGISFTVVGVLKNTLANMQDEQCVYIPYSTYKLVDINAENISSFVYVESDIKNAEHNRDIIKKYLSSNIGFDFSDDKAVFIMGMDEQAKAFGGFFSSMRFFMMFVGVSMLLGGILGIGSVIYASVKERTREIGIRKAVGAKTVHIKSMILGEAMLITTVSGVVGIICGVIVLFIISCFIPEDTMFFKNPTLSIPIVATCVFVFALAGALTGLKPATYAATIEPIDALRVEN